jgi:heme/copper-type cytochrome/quinol oxidase subunit 2
VIANISPGVWTQIIVGLSIFVPVIVATVLAIVILRGKKNDPDEQRWRRLDEQRRDADL